MRIRTLDRAGRAASRAGFTLMELLVVVAILVVLVGVATPLYLSYLEQSKIKIARTDAVRLAGELKNYAVSHDGTYPPEGSWDGVYLEKPPPLDPWGRTFAWALKEGPMIDNIAIAVPVVWSTGKDGISGSQDDISSQ